MLCSRKESWPLDNALTSFRLLLVDLCRQPRFSHMVICCTLLTYLGTPTMLAPPATELTPSLVFFALLKAAALCSYSTPGKETLLLALADVPVGIKRTACFYRQASREVGRTMNRQLAVRGVQSKESGDFLFVPHRSGCYWLRCNVADEGVVW